MNRFRFVVGGAVSATAVISSLAAQEADGSFKNALGYEASAAYPYGRPNPDAPTELAQFAFFIGEYECVDRQKNAEGEWREFPAFWNARYFLNGFGIQDHYYADGFQTSNIRVFFPNENVWKVTYVSAPSYGTGTWEGTKQGDDIVLERHPNPPNSAAAFSRLTFYDITDESFEWKAESIREGQEPSANWTSSCKRKMLGKGE